MNHATLPFRPVFIIGAGRSGTNILRDAICALPDFATWPCDEINPIMRHGNIGMDHDRFTAQQATPAVAQFIRAAFTKEWKRQGKPAFVVEKTCANSLRVAFLNAIFPEALFIHLYRHGGDVIASARKRWRGEMELPSIPYYWAKTRFTPLIDLPIYGWRFVRSRFRKATGQAEHMSAWGPMSPAMLSLNPDASLEEICTRQWVDCVSTASADLEQMDDTRTFPIAYEDFVAKPAEILDAIAQFAGAQVTSEQLQMAAANVRTNSVGKGATVLAGCDQAIRDMAQPVLTQLGYSD
ncbi:MAG: sulfotransferase [Erythrobacter sp.]